MRNYILALTLVGSMLLGSGIAFAGTDGCCPKTSCVCVKGGCCVNGKCECKGGCCTNGNCTCKDGSCATQCNCQKK